MKNYNINRLKKILDLQTEIVGVKFIAHKNEYEGLREIDDLNKKVTYCNMVRRALDGVVFKASAENFFCDYGAYALGIKQPGSSVVSGQSYSASKLYISGSVSRKAVESMRYLQQDIYGVVVGPLQKMSEADVVILLADAYQTMRIVQGYAYKNGMPQNIRSFGNQAMCSDLTSKPFYEGDINVSFLCAGARTYARCSNDQLGVGMPIELFDDVTEGVVNTFNPVAGVEEKQKVLQNLEETDKQELGIQIDMNVDYGRYIKEYDDYVRKLEERYE